MLVDPDALTQVFIDWMKDIVAAITAKKAGLPKASNDHVIALDGKALRVETKSNEIKVIPKILDTLMLEGALITIDAVGCQKSICIKIIEKKADYLLCVKKTRKYCPTMLNLLFRSILIKIQFLQMRKQDFFAETIENNRGRKECCRCW